jgi:hypothetical protein
LEKRRREFIAANPDHPLVLAVMKERKEREERGGKGG